MLPLVDSADRSPLKSVQGEVMLEKAKGRIEVRAVNEGIRLADISGDLSAESTNGSIFLDRIDSGNVDLYTVNGDVSYDGPIKEKGLYRLTTHNGLIAMAIPERVNATLMVRTYNGSFRSSFPVGGGDTGERRKRFTVSLGNGSARVELESFGGTIALRRPGEARPETERRRRERERDKDKDRDRDRDKDQAHAHQHALADLAPEVEADIQLAMLEVQPEIDLAIANVQPEIDQALAEIDWTEVEQEMRDAVEAWRPRPVPTPTPHPRRR